MNVLLIGSGGREHALARALARSPRLERLFAAPGNSGTSQFATNVVLDPGDHRAVVDFCRLMRIGFVVIGPEAPLVAGLVDALEGAGLRAFGPSGAAAQIEGSKGFAKDLCRECDIPTARYGRFSSRAAAQAYLEEHGAPIVVKADGLAAGKGVTVALTKVEAERALDEIFAGAFGAGQVVLEEVLAGEEASLFALCDGERAVFLGAAQDHKRAFDGDEGPNTGGMGAYSPPPMMTDELIGSAMREIVEPALSGLKRAGAPFRGVLFAGLMVGEKGPALIEFNARFGDPETQCLLPRLKGDLLGVMLACAEGRLDEIAPPLLAPLSTLTVVLAAAGYPSRPEMGGRVEGVEEASLCEGALVDHAGLARDQEGFFVRGGRVLSVTGVGENFELARQRAYESLSKIRLDGGFFRRDIGWRALAAR